MTPDDVRALLREPARKDRGTNIGPSEFGGCRRKVWHRLTRTPVTNPATLRLPAQMGTAFHTFMEARLAADNERYPEPRWLLETRVERDGIRGVIDCYDTHTDTVIDWKTTTKRNLPYFPSVQNVWQVHLYGWLMSQERGVKKVALVAFPKDGSEAEIVVYERPYDPRIVTEALSWRESIDPSSEPPAPEKERRFCRSYCEFYDPTGIVGCPSK